MKIRILFAFIVICTLISGTSCISPVDSSKKKIVVTYSILGSLVKDLAGDSASISIMIPDGMDPHEWEPSAKDIEILNKADLIVANGLELEGGMIRTLDQARENGVKIFTATDYITIRHVGSGEGIPGEDPDQAVGASDPHIWTDPVTMKKVVSSLAAYLKTNLSINRDVQASKLESDLESLNKEIADMVSAIPVENRKLVTGHESMGYFAQRYNCKLTGVIIPSLSSQAEVSAADLAQLKKSIVDNSVKVIFAELGTSPAVAQVIAKETGVKVVELITHTLPADGSYFTFMRNLAKVITDALK